VWPVDVPIQNGNQLELTNPIGEEQPKEEQLKETIAY